MDKKTTGNIFFELCDLSLPAHVRAFLALQRAYMTDPMGGMSPHSPEREKELVTKLLEQKEAFQLFARIGQEYVGLANCFYGFSTFRVKKLINIHDLIILPDYRDQGIGRKLLQEIARIGLKNNCCKVTLEVRYDNERAKHLYKSIGFMEHDPPMYFWTKDL